MPMLAEKQLPVGPMNVRRFDLPDISRHGGWLRARLAKTFPHIAENRQASWLTGFVYSSDYLFLSMDHSAALAEIARPYTLNPKPVIYERFVFCESDEYRNEAASFYDEFIRWATFQGVETIIVNEMTDVPIEMIRPKFGGRILSKQQQFGKVTKE